MATIFKPTFLHVLLASLTILGPFLLLLVLCGVTEWYDRKRAKSPHPSRNQRRYE